MFIQGIILKNVPLRSYFKSNTLYYNRLWNTIVCLIILNVIWTRNLTLKTCLGLIILYIKTYKAVEFYYEFFVLIVYFKIAFLK